MNLGRPETWEPIEVLDLATASMRDGPLHRTPATDRFLVARAADGTPCAIGRLCPHKGFALDEYGRHGSRPGTILCAAHSCEFDVATGACVVACGEPVPPLETWPLREGDGGEWHLEAPLAEAAR